MLKQLGISMQDEILSEIENIQNDRNLYQEKKVNARLEAIDYLEFHVIDRLHALMESGDDSDQINILKEHTQEVKGHLEEINNKVFLFFRKKIQEGYRGKALMDLMDEYSDNNVSAFLHQDIAGYDNLDVFLNGIFSDQILPGETKGRESGMVYYQKAPARIILILIENAAFKPEDVFFDLGSGLGQVTILVNLLSSVISKGVEFEPAFYSYAKTSAGTLYLNDVEFIHTDARYADYSIATVFFMYTPFEGKILLEVLQNLQGEAKKRKIRIFTYGPCSQEIAKQNWLIKEYGVRHSSGEFCEFHSV
jgi:Histone methylation protein DOT1